MLLKNTVSERLHINQQYAKYFGPQVYSLGVLSNRPCRSVRGTWSLSIYIRGCSLVFSNFGPWVYPLGSLVIALVRPSVRVCVRVSVFKYLRDRSLVFSETLHEVAGQ